MGSLSVTGGAAKPTDSWLSSTSRRVLSMRWVISSRETRLQARLPRGNWCWRSMNWVSVSDMDGVPRRTRRLLRTTLKSPPTSAILTHRTTWLGVTTTAWVSRRTCSSPPSTIVWRPLRACRRWAIRGSGRTNTVDPTAPPPLTKATTTITPSPPLDSSYSSKTTTRELFISFNTNEKGSLTKKNDALANVFFFMPPSPGVLRLLTTLPPLWLFMENE